MKATFEWKGKTYEVPLDARMDAPSFVQLPDGTMLRISWKESFPPQAYEVVNVSTLLVDWKDVPPLAVRVSGAAGGSDDAR